MKEYTIDEYRDKMLRIAQETLPKESKKILAKETQKLKRRLTSYANANVPPSRIAENDGKNGKDKHLKYNQHFKAGKTYKFNGALSKRAYNEARQGWFVESGRPVARGYRKKDGYKNAQKIGRTKGYNVYHTVVPQFERDYENDLSEWIEKMIGEGKL